MLVSLFDFVAEPPMVRLARSDLLCYPSVDQRSLDNETDKSRS